MNFLEKDLETIVWENYERCATRGMEINQGFYKQGRAYRQMNLAPYGIADLVYIRYYPAHDSWYVQVIELKRGKVDNAAYLQAKRYQTALRSVIEREIKQNQAGDANIYMLSVLIGNELEEAGDFIFGYNTDNSCRAFLYSYDFDGISFKEVGKQWVMTGGATSTQLAAHLAELHSYRLDEQAEYEDLEEIRAKGREVELFENGDWSRPLVITPDGVLFNEDLLAQDLEDAARNGDE